MQRFLLTTQQLDKFFKVLEEWEQILTHEFANLYKAKSEAEAQVIITLDKLNRLAKEQKELEIANEKLERQSKDGVSLEDQLKTVKQFETVSVPNKTGHHNTVCDKMCHRVCHN